MNSLYWHDYETWGATPSIDKPSQFAGVRTDEDLNIIGDPLVCYCQPTPDCLPHPQACLVTGITPQKALSEGIKGRKLGEFLRIKCSANWGYNRELREQNNIKDEDVMVFWVWIKEVDPYLNHEPKCCTIL